MKVTGGREMVARIRAMAGRMPHAVANALQAEAEIEMTEAKQRTPVDSGALRSSGYVGAAEVVGREVSVELGFGGPAAPYAIYVHEDLDAQHPVGQAKYLESVLMESAPHMAARIGKRIEREVA